VCLPGPAVDVVMTPNVKFVEVLVRNCFVVSCGIHSFAGRISLGRWSPVEIVERSWARISSEHSAFMLVCVRLLNFNHAYWERE